MVRFQETFNDLYQVTLVLTSKHTFRVMTILFSAFWYWNGKINRQLKFPSPVSDLWC